MKAWLSRSLTVSNPDRKSPVQEHFWASYRRNAKDTILVITLLSAKLVAGRNWAIKSHYNMKLQVIEGCRVSVSQGWCNSMRIADSLKVIAEASLRRAGFEVLLDETLMKASLQ